MATAVSICSNALIMLGENPINSFTEAASPGGLDRARIADNLWESVRDSLLRSHPWNCAIKRVTLSPEATTPEFGFTYRYILPSDWLRNVEINGVMADDVDYMVEGRRILIDESALKLRYVYRNADPTTWDAMLVKAAELAMASEMAYPITQSSAKEEMMERRFERYMARARAVDGQSESPATLGSFDILAARRAL